MNDYKKTKKAFEKDGCCLFGIYLRKEFIDHWKNSGREEKGEMIVELYSEIDKELEKQLEV